MQKAKEARTKERNNNRLAINIYLKYEEKVALMNNDAEETKILEIIAKSYGVNELERAKEYLEKGKQLVKQDRQDEANYEDNRMYDDAFNESKIIGKEKYISKLRSQCVLLEKRINLEKSLGDLNKSMTTYSSSKQDPFLLVGVASGIAGPVVGTAVALNADSKNRQKAISDENVRNMAKSNCEGWNTLIEKQRHTLNTD